MGPFGVKDEDANAVACALIQPSIFHPGDEMPIIM